MYKNVEKQLELLLPDANQLSLDFISDRPMQVEAEKTAQKSQTAKVCIGNCDACRFCDNSNEVSFWKEVV